MPIQFLDRFQAPTALPGKVRLPKITLPDFGRFITAEVPAIALQMSPALEDIAALTDGVPAGLPAQVESMLSAQADAAFPGAVALTAAIGDKPDHALLRKPLDKLTPDEKDRLPLELTKLLRRRQNVGIFLGPEGKSGLAGRRKGVAAIDLPTADTPLSGAAAPFELQLDLPALSAAANTQLSASPRFDLNGSECPCGPIEVTSLTLRRSGDRLETVADAKADLFLGALHAGLSLHVLETIAPAAGALADPRPEATIEVHQIVGADLPDKLRKILDRKLVQLLLAKLFPVATLLKFALRALASRLATRLANRGEEIAGPVHAALTEALSPRLLPATDQKLRFEVTGANVRDGAVRVAGNIVVASREQAIRVAPVAAGRRAPDGLVDVRFHAVPTDLAAPVACTWTCLGQTLQTGPEATFRIDLAATPEFVVRVSAIDAEGFAAPETATRFRRLSPSIGGLVTFLGTPA